MKGNENPDVEPSEEPESGSGPSTKGRQSFRKVRRELTEDELSGPAAQRLLLDELDRLDMEVVELKEKAERFHIADKKAGVLEEKLKKHTSLEIISSGALAVSGLALGYASKVWGTGAIGPILVAGGVVLLVAGIWAKAVRA